MGRVGIRLTLIEGELVLAAGHMFDKCSGGIAVGEPDRVTLIVLVVREGVGSDFDGSDIFGCEAQARVVDGRSDIAEAVTVYDWVDTRYPPVTLLDVGSAARRSYLRPSFGGRFDAGGLKRY